MGFRVEGLGFRIQGLGFRPGLYRIYSGYWGGLRRY